MHPSPPTLAVPGAARMLSVLPTLMLLIVSMGLGLLSLAPLPATAQDGNAKPVYRCPGPPVLYTDALSAAEARERGCRTIEGAPVTVVQTRPSTPTTPATASAPAAARSADSRVDPAAQRARDSDARRILADELAREEGRMAQLQREFNGGEPERRGDERNYQRYLDRVAEMRAGITRKESDIAALKRELAKLPQ